MAYVFIVSIFVLQTVCIILVIRKFFNEDTRAQRALDRYLRRYFSTDEIGKFYERYIGYLYESKGHEVAYHGLLDGYGDMGRDLLVRRNNETLVIQAKCWSKRKTVQEKHIFQIFGAATHFKLISRKIGGPTKAVFYTTARYSDTARDAARVLGVELRTEMLNRSYPIIKCGVSARGEKFYYLPFDRDYDKIKIDINRNEYFVTTVKEAVDKGFKRSKA